MNITITYNPYLISTEILINGKKPAENSSLTIGEKRRLQEWIENLPSILSREYMGNSFDITFKGTELDYDDVKNVLNCANCIEYTLSFEKVSDLVDIESSVRELYQEIMDGPIEEIKTPSVTEAFERATNASFEVNVIAPVSSGKSSLINALIGKRLLPAGNLPLTAKVVKIINTDQDGYSASLYNRDGAVFQEVENVTTEDLLSYNGCSEIAQIDIHGRINSIKGTGLNLVLVDTPGTNAADKEEHKEITRQMLQKSDNSLVLVVVNGSSIGTEDEKKFYDEICEILSKAGKQSRDRFIFALNKMDEYVPGQEELTKPLDTLKKMMEARGVISPNIFPVTALTALELRDKVRFNLALTHFRQYTELPEYHLDEYYSFNHLPASSREKINAIKGTDNSACDETLIVWTGIVSIEEAISLYINKYARATKIADFVESIKQGLDTTSVIESIKERIKEKQGEIEKIEEVVPKIEEALRPIQERTSNLRNLSEQILLAPEDKEVKDCFSRAKEEIRKYQRTQSPVCYDEANRILSYIYTRSIGIIYDISEPVRSDVSEKYVEISKQFWTIYPEYRPEILNNPYSSDEKSHEKACRFYFFWYDFLPRVKVKEIDNILNRNSSIQDERKYVNIEAASTETVMLLISQLDDLIAGFTEYCKNRAGEINDKLILEQQKEEKYILHLDKLNQYRKYLSCMIEKDNANICWLTKIGSKIDSLISF